jgi:ectoine hydroxylase-related dioxygenase (phytanoyl-CoA dioxygenase family)
MKSLRFYNIITITAIVILFVYILFLYTLEDRVDKPGRNYCIHKDGFTIVKNVLTEPEIEDARTKCKNGDYQSLKSALINNPKLRDVITKTLSPDYQFQDYIWIIQKSSVHTCHRDNNGDFFNEGQKHPSYTMLIYLEDMEKCLGVIPESHSSPYSNNTNIMNNLRHLLCSPGDIILFNANLIHVGAINKKDDSLRIQMKVSHKDDIKVLSYYENYNKILNEENIVPQSIRKIQKNFTCMFPVMSDWGQKENISSARGSDQGATIGMPQKMFSYLFYGKSDYYDLKNVF